MVASLAMPKEQEKTLVIICHLNKLMKDRGLSQMDLHRQSGLAIGTIRGLIKGATIERIDRGSTEKLMEFFDCSFEDLFTVQWT
jgi:DNA-binding Xre family transcriptional regulator